MDFNALLHDLSRLEEANKPTPEEEINRKAAELAADVWARLGLK